MEQEQAADPKETEEEGEEMDLSVDDNAEDESREITPDGEEEHMSSSPAVVQDNEGHLNHGEEENAGQISDPPQQAPAATGGV